MQNFRETTKTMMVFLKKGVSKSYLNVLIFTKSSTMCVKKAND